MWWKIVFLLALVSWYIHSCIFINLWLPIDTENSAIDRTVLKFTKQDECV